MKVTIFNAAGIATMLAEFPDEETLLLNLPEGGHAELGHLDLGTVYRKGGEIRSLPKRPGPWALFDLDSETWIDPRDDDGVAADLAAARQAAIDEVNRLSGAIRSRFITVIPGQEMLYLLKEREAVDWLAADTPSIADYPLVAAEIGITADDADQVAQVYVNMAAMLRLTAAQLETLRLGAVVAIEGAADADGIEAALAQFLGAVQ